MEECSLKKRFRSVHLEKGTESKKLRIKSNDCFWFGESKLQQVTKNMIVKTWRCWNYINLINSCRTWQQSQRNGTVAEDVRKTGQHQKALMNILHNVVGGWRDICYLLYSFAPFLIVCCATVYIPLCTTSQSSSKLFGTEQQSLLFNKACSTIHWWQVRGIVGCILLDWN